jgi:hypothetical protein
VAAADLIIADTVLYCCGRRDHPIGDGRSDGHSEAQRTRAAESSEPVLTLFPVWEKQVFWERIFPGIGKRGEKVVKSPAPVPHRRCSTVKSAVLSRDYNVFIVNLVEYPIEGLLQVLGGCLALQVSHLKGCHSLLPSIVEVD